MSSFKDLRIVDNFYQTSSFFPMPTICISTVNEDGSLNIGTYSLCFPYYIAGKDRYAMVLECRNTSNTCMNLLRTKKCALNFINDDKETLVLKTSAGDTFHRILKHYRCWLLAQIRGNYITYC